MEADPGQRRGGRSTPAATERGSGSASARGLHCSTAVTARVRQYRTAGRRVAGSYAFFSTGQRV
eukprot:1203159-Rhodomonas_salina.3